MPIGIRLTSNGIVETNNGSPAGFAPFKVDAVTAITATTTITADQAGVITLSGATAAPITGTMPAPATIPGAQFTVRSLSVHSHALTASLGGQFTDYNTAGTKLTLSASVGRTVVLASDGLQYVMLGWVSGSYAITP